MAASSDALAIAVEHFHADRLLEAEQLCRQILIVQPDCADAWNILGGVAHKKGDRALAVGCMRRLVELAPDSADALTNLGAVLQEEGNLDQAFEYHRRALHLNSHHPRAHYNLGNAFQAANRLDDAAQAYRQAVELEPSYSKAHNNLGIILREQGQHNEAVECYGKALTLNPGDAGTIGNLGNALLELGKYEEATACFCKAIELSPCRPEPHVGLSQTLLLNADFAHGWPEYEWRWSTGQMPVREFGVPEWSGEALEGRTILLHAEQGLGDTIQFIRYAHVVKNLGAKVIVECQKPILKLLSSCTGIDELIAAGDELPQFHFHVPLLSLTRIFGTTSGSIPALVPYLSADRSLIELWRERLGKAHGLRVGINWRCRPGNYESRKRDIPLELFASLAQIADVKLISLQKDANQDELTRLGERATIFDQGAFDTVHGAFMDTAATMMNLDLVITSDTSIPHLAGALGVPVWIALPFVPNWRWLLNRSDSPWYPTMRLFRQTAIGDWTGIFAQIQGALRERVKTL